MAQPAKGTGRVAFEGSDRWAQIIPVPNAYGVGLGDGYTLFSVTHGGACNWTLPEGMVLDSLSFEGNHLLFTVHGNVICGSNRFEIPKDKPMNYRLKWPIGTQVPMTMVGDEISKACTNGSTGGTARASKPQ